MSVSGITAPYGSGRYPNLQKALIALYDAQNQFSQAYPGNKAEYLPRTLSGVQFAIDDVKRAIDNNDGMPAPPASSLPALPAGVGNVSSGLKVVPTTKPTIASPFMEAALISLSSAQEALKATDPGNKGIFLARAQADVVFTIDNANAGINLVNSLPAFQPKRSAGAAPGPATFNLTEIGIGLLVIVLLIAIGVEQAARKRLSQ